MLTQLQAKRREDLQRRYRAAVNAPTKRREEKEDLQRRALAAQAGPVPTRPQTIHDLRREFGDERRNPDLWDTLPEPLQRAWALHKAKAGEPLSAVEKRSASAPTPVERACLRLGR